MKAGGEAAFQRQVEQLAAYYGWRSYHTHNSQRSAPGFPDLVLVRDLELIFAELKTEKGRASVAQQEWIKALGAVSSRLFEYVAGSYDVRDPNLSRPPCVDVYLWRPSDFDELHARLARGRHQTEPLYRTGAA